jgi:hypothetical protein
LLTIVFMKWLDARGRYNAHYIYGPDHVNRARRMVDRHLHIPHRFVLVTNDGAGIDEGVEIVPLRTDLLALGHRWPKLMLFAPDAHDLFGDQLLYLDLDLVILGDITPLISQHDFRIVKAFTRRMPYNSSMVLLRAGSRPKVWKEFDPASAPSLVAENGISASDQYWIAKALGEREATWDQRDGVQLYREKTFGLSGPLLGSRIVFFPGPVDPSMAEMQRRHQWIVDSWR